MKTVKRMLAIFLAVMVSVALAPGVFATDEPAAPPADPPAVEEGDSGIDEGGGADPGDENKTEEPSPCLTDEEGISAFGEVSVLEATHDVGNSTELASALAAAEDGDTIRLTANITYNNGISITGIEITFDLNGYDLNVVTGTGVGLKVRDYGEVDITGEGEFNVSSMDEDDWDREADDIYDEVLGIGVYAESGSKATVTNATGYWHGVYAWNWDDEDETIVTVNGDSTSIDENSIPVYAWENARVNVYGDVTGGWYAVSACGAGSSVYVKGDVESDGYPVIAQGGASVTIGGNVTGEYSGVIARGAASAITVEGNIIVNDDVSNDGIAYRAGVCATDGGSVIVNGSIIVPENAGYVVVGNGGFYNEIPQSDGVPSATYTNYLEYTDGDNYVWVKKAAGLTYVCQIGTTKYYSLSDAIEAANPGATIKLLVNIGQTTTLDIDKKLTFDMNNKKLTTIGDVNIKGASVAFNKSGGFEARCISVIDGGKAILPALKLTHTVGWAKSFDVDGGSEATVNGSVTLTGDTYVCGANNSMLRINGNVLRPDHGLRMSVVDSVDNSEVTVTGNVSTAGSGLYCYDSDMTVGGNVTAGEDGAWASTDSSIVIGGSVTAGEDGAWVGTNSSIVIGGNVTAGETGVYINDNGNVVVGGNIGAGTRAVCSDGYDAQATIYGNVTGGSGDYCLSAYAGEIIVAGSVTSVNYEPVLAGVDTVVIVGGKVTREDGKPEIARVNNGGKVVFNGPIPNPARVNIVGSAAFELDEISADMLQVTPGYTTYTRTGGAVWVKEQPVPLKLLTVAPAHATLAEKDDEVTFTVALSTGTLEPSELDWSVWDGATLGANSFSGGNYDGNLVSAVKSVDARTYTVSLDDDAVSPVILHVKAVYDDNGVKYTATATIEILSGGIRAGTAVQLLESKATINTAKIKGALVPVLISNRPDAKLGIMGAMSAFSSVIDYNAVILSGTHAGKFAAAMTNDRYLEIKAKDGTKNGTYKGVVVEISGVPAGTIDLTVTEKFPKITLKTGTLNLAFPDEKAAITATSNDGECTVLKVEIVKAAQKGMIVFENGDLKMDGTKVKKALTVNTVVSVDVAGYKKPYKSAPKLNIKIVNTLPKLKLSKKTIVLAGGDWATDAASVFILSNDKKVSTEDIVSKIESVEFDGNEKNKVKYEPLSWQDDSKGEGELQIKRNLIASNGSGNVIVTFKNGPTVKLPLTLTMRDPAALTVSSNAKTATIHKNHGSYFPDPDKPGSAAETGSIIDIPVTVNADNVFVKDWKIKHTIEGKNKTMYKSPGHDYYDAFETETAKFDNNVNLAMKDRATFISWFIEKNADFSNKKVDLYIGSESIDPDKTFKITLTMTSGDSSKNSVKVSNSGKINVADKDAVVTATLTLKNTSSPIAAVVWDSDSPESDFMLDGFGKNTITLKLNEDRSENIRMVAQTMMPRVWLENGDWVRPSIKVTPVFTKGKARQSLKDVTLYKTTPHTGVNVDFGISAPAFAGLGTAVIEPVSYGKLGFDEGGFQLVRAGESTWTVAFKDYKTPVMKPNVNKGKLKANYSLKVQLWQAGTYLANANGEPIDESGLLISDTGGKVVPLKNAQGAVKTSPTVVTVKVNVK